MDTKNNLIGQILAHKEYLNSTDYIAIREYEGGETMPLDIKNARALSRASINTLENQIAEIEINESIQSQREGDEGAESLPIIE
jgi:hypothetical protein